jgi:5,10-methylenetetrahydromethanopterin reductase
VKIGILTTRVTARESAEVARACEAHGLDSVWVAEDLWHRAAMPVAAACALATERIRVGVGVVNPYSQHPSQIAMNFGTLAELSGGRAVLAVGASVKRWVEQMGYTQDRPRTRVAEAIAIVRELLQTGISSFEGREYRLDELALGFSPGVPAPLFMAAMGERSVRTCGAVGDGWMVSLLLPASYVRAARVWLAEGAAEAGRDAARLEISQYIPFACSEDVAAARAQAKELAGLFMVGDLDLFREQPPVLKALSGYLEHTSEASYHATVDRLREGVPAVEAVPDTLLDEVAVCGTPEQCAAQLRRFADAGTTEAVLLPAGDGVAAAEVLGTEIRPRLREV